MQTVVHVMKVFHPEGFYKNPAYGTPLNLSKCADNSTNNKENYENPKQTKNTKQYISNTMNFSGKFTITKKTQKKEEEKEEKKERRRKKHQYLRKTKKNPEKI